MIHATRRTTGSGALANTDGSRAPGGALGLVEALGLLAKHVSFIQAGHRQDRNRLALELVSADIERVLASAGMVRHLDDRGDEWAELDGSVVMWLGHHAEREGSAVRP